MLTPGPLRAQCCSPVCEAQFSTQCPAVFGSDPQPSASAAADGGEQQQRASNPHEAANTRRSPDRSTNLRLFQAPNLRFFSPRGQQQQPRAPGGPGGRRGDGDEDGCPAGRGLHAHHHLPAGAGGHPHLLEVPLHSPSSPPHLHPPCLHALSPLFPRNCVQVAHFYTDDGATPKVVSAPSTPLLLATGDPQNRASSPFTEPVFIASPPTRWMLISLKRPRGPLG